MLEGFQNVILKIVISDQLLQNTNFLPFYHIFNNLVKWETSEACSAGRKEIGKLTLFFLLSSQIRST